MFLQNPFFKDYPNPAELHVICVISNPIRFDTRYRLYVEFVERMKQAGVTLWTVESQQGPYRPFCVTEADNEYHVQIRNTTELWIKEPMINAGIARMTEKHPDWSKAMWCDTDIAFSNRNWVSETIFELDRYDVLQPWSIAHDLCPKGQSFKTHKGFFYMYHEGGTPTERYENWHPGYAMAFTRKAFDTFGGFPEFCIAGSGDRTTCTGLIGQVEVSVAQGVTEEYRHAAHQWQKRAMRLQMNVGYVPGTILHYFHGKKRDRNYVGRWQILKRNQFNPYEDIQKNSFGIIELTGNKPRLRDDLRKYFQSRNEDSVDLE